jgi:hypothetical protein
MAGSGKIVPGLLRAVTLVLPLIDGKNAKAAAAADALRQLLEEAKGLASGPKDRAALDELQARVNAHADQVAARLRTTQ